jgi:hypothetical protein
MAPANALLPDAMFTLARELTQTSGRRYSGDERNLFGRNVVRLRFA